MADNAQMYGLRFHSTRSGSGTPNVLRKRVASAYNGSLNSAAVDMNIGDVVKLVNDGTVALVVAGDTTMFGVIVGIGPYWDGSKLIRNSKLPNSAGAYSTNYDRETTVFVIPFEDAIFEIDCDDASSATTFAAYRTLVGNNGDLVTTGNATTGKASYMFDISDAVANTTASAQMRILDISPTLANQDFSGNYVKLLVVANEVSTNLPGYDSGATGV